MSVGYERWCEENEDELWIKFHETGANYDSDYEAWCEWEYERQQSCRLSDKGE